MKPADGDGNKTSNKDEKGEAAWAEALALAREETDSLLLELASLEEERQKALSTIMQLKAVGFATDSSYENTAGSGSGGGGDNSEALSPRRALALASSVASGGLSNRSAAEGAARASDRSATNDQFPQHEGEVGAGVRNGAQEGVGREVGAGNTPRLSDHERADLIAQTTQEVRGIAEEELAMADVVIAELRAQLAELQGELANTKAELTARLATPSDLPAKLTRQESMEREAASLTLQVLHCYKTPPQAFLCVQYAWIHLRGHHNSLVLQFLLVSQHHHFSTHTLHQNKNKNNTTGGSWQVDEPKRESWCCCSIRQPPAQR